MIGFLRDVGAALRHFSRRPGFAAVAVAVLALAIGANAAVYTLVQAVLLREPGFADPSRLVFVWERNTVRNRDRNVAGPYNFTRWQERARSFEGMAAFSGRQASVRAAQQAERVAVGFATGNLFSVLGVGALHGRTLTEADSRPGAPDVVVLGEDYWRRRLEADPSVVGRTILLDGRVATVVGVVPRSFQVPPESAVWTPITVDERLRQARGRWAQVVARLRPGVSLEQARDEMTRLAAQLVQEKPDFNTGWSTSVYPMHGDLVREVRPALLVLTGAVGLLLLVACANVANLLLARAVEREREVAIRTALGATPWRLVRQLAAESLVLAAAGGVAGLALGVWMLQALSAELPLEVRALAHIGLDPLVVAFTAGASLLSALVSGLAPALQLTRPSLVPSLKEGGAVRGAGSARRRLSDGIVVAEVALSLVLTAGTAVLLRSFWNLMHVDPGFRAEGVLTVGVDLPTATYPGPERQAAYFVQAVERLARLPGVTAAGAMSWAPFGVGSATRFRPLDRPAPEPGQGHGGDVRMITPGLLEAMGVPLLAGRTIRGDDVPGRSDVVVVNRTLADEVWPGADPLGKRIHMEWNGERNAEVVGVVGDVRLTSLDRAPRPTLYWPVAQVPNSFMTLMVRTNGDPRALAGAVRAELAAIDPEVPPGPFRTLGELVDGSLERQRFLVGLLAAFALLALLLATVGVYGVMSHAVVQRIPEVGVRLAVGARPVDMIRLVLGDAARLGTAGVAAGVAAALLAAGALQGLVFGVAPRDPLALASVAALLLLTTLLAAALPAWRASRVDPIRALRTD